MKPLQQVTKVLRSGIKATGSTQQGDTNMATLKAINDYVFVELVSTKSNVTDTGIIMSSVEQPTLGRVLSVGPGKYNPNGTRQEHKIAVDDIIIFGKSSLNQPIEHEDVVYYVMKVEEVFGKYNG